MNQTSGPAYFRIFIWLKSKMKTILRKIDDQSLTFKILCVGVSASLILSAGSFGILQLVSNAYNEIVSEKNAQSLVAYAEQMENSLEKLNIITLSMIGDSIIQRNLAAYETAEPLSIDWTDIRRNVSGQLRNYTYDFSDFLSIGIYTPELHVIGSKATGLSREDTQMLFDKGLENKGVMDIMVLNNRVFLIRQIRQLSSLENLGVIIGELDIAGLLRENSREHQKIGFNLMVSVFVDDCCVYSDDDSVQCIGSDGWVIENDYLITQYTARTGWVYLLYTPYGQIAKTIRDTNITAILLTAVLTVCVIILCRYFLKRTLRHLDKLVLQFDAYGKGVLPTQEDAADFVGQKNEIDYLYRQFYHMAYERKRLEDENYNRMLLNKEAQYKQLQVQIQPHFIFNTLSLICWMAYQHNDNEIAELTNALSQLLRGSMHFSENLIPVEREMRLVDNYIHIQKIRYGKRIDFRMDIPESMHQVQIPQMTLQPLVENAITHALEEMVETCSIHVHAEAENGSAIFYVEDNGSGIDENILEKLASGEVQAKGNGVGLLNVHRRIQLAFSEKYGLSFRRRDDKTQVIVTVPFDDPSVSS